MTTHIPSLTLPAFLFDRSAASILVPLVLGNAIGFASRPAAAKKRYRDLKQPPLNPPPYVFGPVWTTLYAAMGYAAHRAWHAGTTSLDPGKLSLAQQGATLYTLQLGLNLLWMPLFFVAERPVAASVDVVALLGTAGYLTYVWSKVDKMAAWIMAPYLGWLGFATYLCVGCGYLNGWSFEKGEGKKAGKET